MDNNYKQIMKNKGNQRVYKSKNMTTSNKDS